MEFRCSLTLLEGISNWINNCLIPISRLDLSAHVGKAVFVGKTWQGERGRGGVGRVDTVGERKTIGEESRSNTFVEIASDEVVRARMAFEMKT